MTATATALLLIITLLFTTVTCKPTFIENDSIVFPDNDTDTGQSNTSDKLMECILDNFKIEFNGECRSLLTTENACPERYWLVLDLFSATLPKPRIRGKCALKACIPSFHYWQEQRRCVHSNESTSLCPVGNTIKTDYFGDGYCECNVNPVHARDRSGICYPVFRRGPCSSGRVWVKVNGRVECRADHCEGVRNSLLNKTIVPWTDNRCYELGERGPCKQGYVISINMWSYRPECDDPLTPLNLFDPPCSGTDHTNKCTASVNTPQNNFYNQVAQQASRKGGRKGIGSPK